MEGKSLALLILSGNQEGKLLPLVEGEELLIGRKEGLDLVLPEDLVSRRHARITVEAGTAVLHDLGSTNGTFVNGKRVREVTLKEGDRILLGSTILSVVPHEELLLPSGSSLSEALAAISPGPSAAEVVEEVTGAGKVVEAEGGAVPGEQVTGAGEEEVFSGLSDAVQVAFGGEIVEGAPAPALPLEARLGVAEGAPPLRELTPQELDLFQAALLGQPVADVIEQARADNAHAVLLSLVERGYLRVITKP